jgi:hypothetical protein
MFNLFAKVTLEEVASSGSGSKVWKLWRRQQGRDAQAKISTLAMRLYTSPYIPRSS